MVETHEYKGLWWLPSDEENQLWGMLTITKGEADLELLGHFGHEILSQTDTEILASGSLVEHPRIVGLSSDGKAITLEGHIVAPYTEHFPGIPIANYRRSVALVGKHFAEAETVGFDEIAIRASDLNAWTQVVALTRKYRPQRGKRNARRSIAFEVPKDIDIPLARGEKASIKFGVYSEGLYMPSDRGSLRQDATLYLRFARRASLERVFDRVGEIRNLLSLAIGRPVTILSVVGFQDDYRREVGPDVPIPIELFWGIPHNPDQPTRARMPHEMFFTLPEASPDISAAMRRWFARQKRLSPVFHLFFGVRYHPDLFLDVRFLLFAQAVETYDYRRRLKPGNLTLAQRVTDVLALCPTASKKIVGPAAADRDAFIQLFKDSRNYYTHYNPKLERKAAKGAALYLLTVQLQAILEASLLRELGFKRLAIDAILQRAGRYNEIASQQAFIAQTAP